MSTGLIIAIVIVALVLIAIAFLLPRMRAKAVERARTRELEQRGIGRVELVAQHVEVLVLGVHGGELRGGGEADAARAGRREGLLDAPDGVVVREREELDPRGGGARDDLPGRQRAVGLQGVGLEVEPGGNHRLKPQPKGGRGCPPG